MGFSGFYCKLRNDKITGYEFFRAILSSFDGKFSGTIDPWCKTRGEGADSVEDFSRGLKDDLDDGVRNSWECDGWELCVGLASVVLILIDGDGPAGELGSVAIGNFCEAGPAFKGGFAGFSIEAD